MSLDEALCPGGGNNYIAQFNVDLERSFKCG